MDIIWVAAAVDLALCGALGAAVTWYGRHGLPPPWNEFNFTIAIAVAIGSFGSTLTYTHWLAYARH